MTSETEDHENVDTLNNGHEQEPEVPTNKVDTEDPHVVTPAPSPAAPPAAPEDPVPAAPPVLMGEPLPDAGDATSEDGEHTQSSHDLLAELGLAGEPEDYYEEEEEEEEEEVVLEFDIQNAAPLSFTALQEGRATVFKSMRQRQAFERAVEDLSKDGMEGRRRGLAFWMLGRYADCAEQLATKVTEGDDSEAITATYTRARALMAIGNNDEAAGLFQGLADAHPDEPRPRAGLIEARMESELAKDPEDPSTLAPNFHEAIAAAPGNFAESAEGCYLLGRTCELERDWEQALDHYTAGREAQPEYAALLTRYGHLAERCGLDELALKLYTTLVKQGAADRNVLMNLGILYEDLGRDHDAAACYDVVAKNDPTDRRARLYLGDAHAGTTMFYDEDLEKKEDRLNQILRIPITDFELSVRARNCLNKMLINTLGDLVQRTEQELLSYKNFGETSLTEIKEILHSKGLRLGMPREEAVASIEAHANRSASGDRANVLNKPILELQLSIRARRTVETLGCLTLGEVTKHSAEELLGMPNFGQTSLQELRSKLNELGLKLKGD